MFPAGLLEYVEPVEIGDLGAVALDDLDSADPQQIRLFQPQAPVLELVRKGRRNITLFDAVRFWAYRARKTTYDEWLRAVEIRTLVENRRFAEPLTERHAKSTAYSIAVWTWTTYRGGYGRGFTMEQRRRGGENKARRVRYDNRERDSEIVRCWEAGESLKGLGRGFGLTLQGVRHIVRRDTPG